jgi:hypothetical protein
LKKPHPAKNALHFIHKVGREKEKKKQAKIVKYREVF